MNTPAKNSRGGKARSSSRSGDYLSPSEVRRTLTELIEAIAVRQVDDRLIKRFNLVASDKLYSMRNGQSRKNNLSPDIPAISTILARREVAEFKVPDDAKKLARAVYGVLSLIKSVGPKAPARDKASVRALGAELAAALGPTNQHPNWIRSYFGTSGTRPPSNSALQWLAGMSPAVWNQHVRVIRSAQMATTKPLLDRLQAGGGLDHKESAADRLTRVAQSISQTADVERDYDASDSSLKILSVRVQGFRGSPASIEVQFDQSGRPVSTLLWGDNGTGKSSVIDGIEFALQGRVDRCADFNSSLQSSVQNIASEVSLATVNLSDGTSVTRSLQKDGRGRFKATREPVRPGFRIAPVVIRRADILRFLDTETLARGTVFFDYFPEPDGSIGQRPTEDLRALEEEQFSLRVTRGDLSSQLRGRFPDTSFDLSTSDGLERFVRTELLVGATGDVSQEHWEALDEGTRQLVTELRTTQTRLRTIKKKLAQGVSTLNPVAYQRQLERVRPVLESIAPVLTASFQRIANVPHVKALHTLVGHSGPVSLDIVVEFTNGASAFPQQVFSEGYKDLIALLFFLAVTKRAAELGQAKVLILDDALQSVDASIRMGLMRYVLDEFTDWQLIVTGHDKAWHSQLRALFNTRGISVADREIMRWDFESGPVIREGSWTTLSSLQNALERADAQAVASASGILLEQIVQELSWRLGTSVKRKQGDRYTLADLWSGVHAVLRKRESAKKVCEDINTLISIRNLLGAHYNDWAASIPNSDVFALGEAIIALHGLTYCEECSSWVQRSGLEITCKKGHKSV